MFADRELARRLEYAEGAAGTAFVEARKSVFPDSGACWTDIAGARCLFDGAASPVTQTFGLGVSAPVTDRDFEAIERFFRERASPISHEVSPLADPSVLVLLNDRGYRALEWSTVLVRELAPGSLFPPRTCKVRFAEPNDSEHWSSLSAQGWEHPPEFSELFSNMATLLARRSDFLSFYAEVDGTLAATGSLLLHDQVAVLAGASTIREFRGRGAQQSLLAYRLQYAALQGCTLASMAASPGSSSQRNAERNGFQVAYTRTKWQLV